MDGRWFSQEVEESCGDGDLAVLILFELDDAPDELNESNDASDEDEGQNKLDDSGNDSSVEELVDSKSAQEEDDHQVQNLVDFLHVDRLRSENDVPCIYKYCNYVAEIYIIRRIYAVHRMLL